MKDETRERLSAYLDGALSDSQRRAVEAEVELSVEMRHELEALRDVSAAVKGLGKEKLPEGFMARLQARRAREEAAARPSGYRPLALALSTAVIALVIWDRTRSPREVLNPLPDWDGGGVALQSAAPAQPAAIGALQETGLDGRRRNALNSVRGASAKTALAQIAAPVVNAISLKNAADLQTAWTAAGLPGKPPSVDFSAQMAIFLAGPPGCGIVSVQDHNTSIVVLYKDAGFNDAFARVRAVTPSPKPVTAKPAN
jgi:hypothetical protein